MYRMLSMLNNRSVESISLGKGIHLVVGFIGLLGAATAIFALVMPVYFARKTDGYLSIRDTLSELGATGQPFQYPVSRYYFLPLSIAITVFIVLGQSAVPFLPQDRFIWGLLGLVAVGYLVAAIFPCDLGSPLVGTTSNKLHNIAGGLEYIGAGLGLVLMGLSTATSTEWPHISLYLILSGSVILLSLILLVIPSFQTIKGAVQRLAEASFFIWMLVISLLLLFSHH